MVAGGAIEATGTVVLVGTLVVMVVEQPDRVLVITHVYIPPTVTVPVEVVAPATAPGPVHEYITGVEVVVATTCTLVLVQVMDPELEAVPVGTLLPGTTDTVPELEQPVAGFVTVNV